MGTARQTLSKQERLSGKTAVSNLVREGRYRTEGCLRYCVLPDNGTACSRIVVSVPKRLFKRAVKRNLLKRRIRESFRTQKTLLGSTCADILLTYIHPEILPLETIRQDVAAVLRRIAKQTPGT